MFEDESSGSDRFKSSSVTNDACAPTRDSRVLQEKVLLQTMQQTLQDKDKAYEEALEEERQRSFSLKESHQQALAAREQADRDRLEQLQQEMKAAHQKEMIEEQQALARQAETQNEVSDRRMCGQQLFHAIVLVRSCTPMSARGQYIRRRNRRGGQGFAGRAGGGMTARHC